MTFNDYVLPNEALSKGDIDVNAFQHKPYLDQQIKDRGYKLVAVGNTLFTRSRVTRRKSNRWTNCSRARRSPCLTIRPTSVVLLLLQQVGLIKLKDGVGLLPTVAGHRREPEKSENC